MRSRIIVLLFDLPSKTNLEKKKYRDFVKYLKKNGYRRIQNSIFAKHIRNADGIKGEMLLVKKIAPEGNVAMFSMSSKQFANINYIRGDGVAIEMFTDPIIVI